MNNWTIDKLERNFGSEMRATIHVEDRAKTDDEKNTYVFTMSDEIMDRHGTIVKLDGLDIEEYNRNPVVLLQHQSSGSLFADYDIDNVIGKGYAYRDKDGLLKNKITFEPKELNEKADKVLRKIEFGSVRASSIGFIANEGSWGNEQRGEDPDIYYIRKGTLLEHSIVVVPSNPNALVDKDYDQDWDASAIEAIKKEIETDATEQTELTDIQETTTEILSPRRQRAINKLRYLKLRK